MIEVAAAIIQDQYGRFLIARRKKGKSQEGLWEFPGGKLEPGESTQECLQRELSEEMSIEIEPTSYFGVHEHDYGTVQIRLIAYNAKFVRGEIKLVDHDEFRWVEISQLADYDFAPADIPFVESLVVEAHKA